MNTKITDATELVDFEAKIAGLLNESTQQMDAATNAKLLASRKEALAHFSQGKARALAPDWVVAGAQRISAPFGGNWRVGFAMLALATAAACAMLWQGMQSQGSEIAEIDEGLLTDDLPINAYLEKGFDSWAKRQSR